MNKVEKTIQEYKLRMQMHIEHFVSEIAKLRNDRINSELIEGILVLAYDQRQPLKHIANILSSGPRSLEISVWDQSLIPSVEKVLRESDLGVSPQVQGKSILLNFPPMSDESRERMVKILHQKQEEVKISLRSEREEGLRNLKKEKDSGAITEDEFFKARSEFDTLTQEQSLTIDQIGKKKENGIIGQ